jgi:hypothetical protein
MKVSIYNFICKNGYKCTKYISPKPYVTIQSNPYTYMLVSIHVFSSNPQNKYGKEIKSEIIYPIVQNWYFQYLWILEMKIHTIWNI